ncbi:hypothetical protein GCM10011611_48140 [Aliidongia dinghuensis]|uniref:Uncharacterized protein n=1 Tax=Aliidongia dinghuensis TaxID=1867774 RepID=A0A8J3E5X5_9PROT|nr:hypothetical protein [Aliidongia dinghuensis]GGF36098.1 hypothetical protein GCM10011611_48140 [Aliidongia dinghuensis]
MVLDAFWLALLVKIVATASVVVAASVVAERAGPFWGALITCLPVVAGPAYVLLALQADAAFVAASATSGVAANAATGLFVLTLHRMAPRRGALPSLTCAIAVWLGAILAIRATSPWSAVAGLALNLVVYGAALRVAVAEAGTVAAAAPARWFELPLRALSVGLLVAGAVSISQAIGPSATGLAMAFPIAMTSLTVMLYRRLGGVAVGWVMANSLKAMPGLAVALFAVAETVVPFGVASGLVLGLLASLAWSLGLMALRYLSLRRASGFPKATGA